MKVRCAILAAIGAAACAGNRPLPPGYAPANDAEVASAAEERSSRLEQDLSALFAGAAPRDCGRTCALVEEICDLSERICSIAARHREDTDLRSRCASSEQRCARSRATAGAACLCGK